MCVCFLSRKTLHLIWKNIKWICRKLQFWGLGEKWPFTQKCRNWARPQEQICTNQDYFVLMQYCTIGEEKLHKNASNAFFFSNFFFVSVWHKKDLDWDSYPPIGKYGFPTIDWFFPAGIIHQPKLHSSSTIFSNISLCQKFWDRIYQIFSKGVNITKEKGLKSQKRI